MGFWEIIALGGTMGTILGVFLTAYAIINNRVLKEESRLTREYLEKSLKEARESTVNIIKEESRLTRESLKETREFLAEILDRIDKRAEERHREVLHKA